MPVFTAERRERLRSRILARAAQEPTVTACALVGSVARDAEDRWSDIDVALRLGPSVAPMRAADNWMRWLAANDVVADTVDVHAAGALYRVFLLADSLQVDLSFWPEGEFRSTGGPFRLVFGNAGPPRPADGRTELRDDVGAAWLHALHVRSALARGRDSQAAERLASMRLHLVALALIPPERDPGDQTVGLVAHLDVLLDHLPSTNPGRARRLEEPFALMRDV